MIAFNESPAITLDIELFNNLGHKIKWVRTKNKVTTIPVSELPAGNYFIKITGNKHDQTIGVIITH
jgi:hypothetical protein